MLMDKEIATTLKILFLGILWFVCLFIFGCISKIKTPPDAVSLKDISMCATVEYQDKVAQAFNERDRLQHELNSCLLDINLADKVIKKYQDEISLQSAAIEKLSDSLRECQNEIQEVKNQNNILKEKFKNTKKALSRAQDEITRIEKKDSK